MEINEIPRVFKYDKKDLPDPNPKWSTKQVVDFYSSGYPELVNATIDGGEFKDNQMTFEIKTVIGTKG